MTMLRLLLALSLGLTAFLGGCPGDDGGTVENGPPQDVLCEVSALVPQAGRADGWTITLTRAEIALSQPTFYGNSTHETVVKSSPGFFAIPAAYAHAGHAHGEADAEAALDGSYVVDLLADTPTVLGTLSMLPALYFDGKLRLEKTIDDGHGLVLAGSAVDSEGTAHDFALVIDVEGWVAGLEFDFLVTNESAPDALRLVVNLDTLLADLDLSTITPDADGGLAIGPDSGDLYTALKAGIQDPSVYVQAELLH